MAGEDNITHGPFALREEIPDRLQHVLTTHPPDPGKVATDESSGHVLSVDEHLCCN